MKKTIIFEDFKSETGRIIISDKEKFENLSKDKLEQFYKIAKDLNIQIYFIM